MRIIFRRPYGLNQGGASSETPPDDAFLLNFSIAAYSQFLAALEDF